MKATVLMRQPGRVQEIVGALRKGGETRYRYRGARSVDWWDARVAGEWPALGALPRCCRHVQASLQPLEIAKGLEGKPVSR